MVVSHGRNVLTLVTGDIHLSSNRRDLYRVKTMRALATMAKRRGIGRTIILGDLTEEKDRHSDWLVNQLVEIVCLFSALGDVHILQGNHDFYSDPDCPFFHFLRHMPRVRWHRRAALEQLDGFGSVLWLPFVHDQQKAWHGLPFDKAEIIFFHGMRVGAELGNGRTSTEGVPRGALPRDVPCYAADVHIPQSSGAFHYVGAPYLVDFGDAYNPRAIVLGTGGDREDDITLGHLPQKRLIEFDGSIDELDAIDGLNEGDILKIRVHLSRKGAARWPWARDRLRKIYTDLGCVVHAVVPVVTEQPGARVRLQTARVRSDRELLREFGTHRGIDAKTVQYGEKLL